MEIYHVTMAGDGRRRLFPYESELRKAVRIMVQITGLVLVLFNIVDDHLHMILAASRKQAGRLAQALNLALSPIAAVPFQTARIRPVETRSHLERLVTYILSQGPKHGLPEDPALWSGSCFLDLVGARFLRNLKLQLPRALPRFRTESALESVGLSSISIRPASDEDVFIAGPSRLISATAAALTLSPQLDGQFPLAVEGRALAARLGYQAGFSTADLSRAMAVTKRTVKRLDERTIPAPLVRAVRVRLGLENAVPEMRRKVGRSP